MARIKAPLAQRRSRFPQGLNKGIRPQKKGAQRVVCERSTLRLPGVPAWRHQSQGSNEIRPAEGPSLVISLRPLPASQSCFTGDDGGALPNATSPGERGQTGPVSSVNGGKKKEKNSHQLVSSGPGAFAPIFQKLTIEAPEKHLLPPPLVECLAGSGDPSTTGNERSLGMGWGGTGLEPPSSLRPRKGWRGHGCKVLGFFSLPDMNKGIRTASFRQIGRAHV